MPTTIAAFQPPLSRTRVAYPQSAWMHSVERQLTKLTSLSRGWDGYLGRAVSFDCAMFAANLLERICVATIPPPHLVPGSDGTIQIEWHRNQFDVEIEISGPFNVFATRYSYETDETEELELTADFTGLMDWISGLGSPVAIVPLNRVA